MTSMDPKRIIPDSWTVCRWWQIAFWALLGNDEDGIAGERGGVPGYDGVAVTWRSWWHWWSRNPLHNLFWHVLALPLWWSIALIGTPEKWPVFWPSGTGFVVALNTLPMVSFRTARWEGYVGFRPNQRADYRRIAVFGIAFRRRG